MIGRTIAHYEVLDKLGEGGMGVVYKARDTHLDRFVAIKILPPERVADPERKRRFVQEAKAASALNHPNIITIHDITQESGIDFMVMEYVPGKTLDELIPRKGMRLNRVLKVAVQITEALAAAHAAGIVHRDLKPGNVMVTEDGRVKVLDFGLAKLTETAATGEDEATRTLKPATEEGAILGTVAYMSPEQAQGKPVDARSDIFSFGAVLYEMLSGRCAFQGDSRMATLAAVIREEPKPPGVDVPQELCRLVSRCLRKDPAWRFQHMDDLKVALAELSVESDTGKLAAAKASERRRGRRWTWAAAGAVVAVALAAGGWLLLMRSPRAGHQAGPSLEPVTAYPGSERHPTFSPDGNEIAFSWDGERHDNADIYRKLIGPGEPLRLTQDPAPDCCPAWSPDGRQIAFLRTPLKGQTQVRVVPSLGGAERLLAEVAALPSYVPYWHTCLAWTADGKWLIGPNLRLVSAETGEGRLLLPRTGAKGWDLDPALSPDARTLAFVRRLDYGIGDVYLLRLSADLQPVRDPQRLTFENREISSPVWTPDGREIVFSSGKVYSERRLLRVRAAAPENPNAYRPDLTAFGDGAITLAVSRDGRRLAYAREILDTNIYRFRLSGPPGRSSAPEKLIASTGIDGNAEYSPDGREIAFVSSRSGTEEIWIANADGSRPRQLTTIGGPMTSNARWSPDGRTILFDSRREGSADLYLVSSGGGAPRRLTDHPAYDGEARFSRDGRWIYFPSTRTGRTELYRMPAAGGEAVQVTRNGGGPAFESPDGKWIYYGKGGDLWKVPAGGGEESRVLGPLSYRFNFVVVDEGIYFIPGATQLLGTQPFRLEFHDFASRKTRLILQTDKPWTLGISLSPDKRWAVFSQFDQAGSDIMLVENFR
jgi:Tol biopolymer transport system component/predicted Ser/Thr protein kinase